MGFSLEERCLHTAGVTSSLSSLLQLSLPPLSFPLLRMEPRTLLALCTCPVSYVARLAIGETEDQKGCDGPPWSPSVYVGSGGCELQFLCLDLCSELFNHCARWLSLGPLGFLRRGFSFYAAQADLRLTILLPQPPECWELQVCGL